MKIFYKNLHFFGYDYFTIPRLTFVEAVNLLEDNKVVDGGVVNVRDFRDDELRVKMLAKKALNRRL